MAAQEDVLELKAASLSERFVRTEILTCDILKLEKRIPYDEFFERFLYRNQPCIISNFITEGWKSRLDWVSNGKPNVDYLQESYGYVEVPVADCSRKYFNVQQKTDTPLSQFLCYWKESMEHESENELDLLYMKDWHFTKCFPESQVYRVPQYFASDWLNEYLTERKRGSKNNDDYRFVYMGPMGSWTPLHVDVFTSFSWSVNICGRKRWLLFPPGQENKLKDKFKQLVYDVHSSDLLDETLFPHYKELEKSYEVIQEEGEAIFVPSGWHHQVWNLEDTISINHNWVNGCNINIMWSSLHTNLESVKKEIEDCKEMDGWEEHCQVMLRATFGMNYIDYFSFLHFIGQRRLDFLTKSIPIVLYGDWKLGRNHTLFDLSQLRDVLNILLLDEVTKQLKSFKDLNDLPMLFIREIDQTLKDIVD